MNEREAAHHHKHSAALPIVRRYAAMSAGIGLIPIPGVDVTALAGVHIALIKALTEHYGESFSDHAARNIVIAIGVSLVPSTLGSVATRRILGVAPFGIGSITGSITSATASYALGRVVMAHFENGGTLHSFDVKDLNKLMWWRHQAAPAVPA